MQNTVVRKLKQVPEGYLVVGVDPHKKKHAAVAITQDFTTQAKFKFDNTREGFEIMLHRTKMEMVKTSCRGVIFAIETGGHYWRNIAYFLDGRGILFRLENISDNSVATFLSELEVNSSSHSSSVSSDNSYSVIK